MDYLITITTYGTWVHGDERGSVKRKGQFVNFDSNLKKREERSLKHPPIVFTNDQRAIVERTIREVCEYRHWELLALNVRTNHVHAVVSAGDSAEKIMNSLKSYATRRLREAGELVEVQKIWTKHGSTRPINGEVSLRNTIHYVLECQ